MSIAERIKLLSDHAGSQVKLAAKTGITNATISKIISKGGLVRSDNLEAILKAYPGLNARWLLTGEEPMWFFEKSSEEGESAKLKELKRRLEEKEELMNRVTRILEKRIELLEKEILKENPERASKLGISNK